MNSPSGSLESVTEKGFIDKMVTRAIKNEKDFALALSRIEQLMDAKPGTAEMEELESLTSLVEMYEEHHFPIEPPDPVDAIKFRMEQQGIKSKVLR
jgi:HTH-type transcriptional regulator / antitoxin HigA